MTKNTISNWYKVFFIVTLTTFVSCEDTEEAFPHSETNTTISSKTSSLSVLDRNHNMEFDYATVNGANVESMNVDTNGSSTALTLSNNVASFNSSVFGNMKDGEDESFDIVTTLSDGYKFRNLFSISIYKAIKATKTPEVIRYKSNIEDTLTVKTSTKSAVIDKVSLYWKKNKNGSYVVDNSEGTLNTDTHSIYFKNVDNSTNGYGLAVNDTLYYRFIAESGSLTDTIEVKLPVLTQEYSIVSSESSMSNSVNSNGFNLKTSKTLKSDNNDAEIKYDAGNIIKAGSTQIEFVEITDISSTGYSSKSKLVAAKDLLITKDLFDANTTVTSFSPNSPDKLIGYKITRVDGGVSTTSYGLMLITETFSNTSGNGFKFSYGEGTLK